MVICLERVADLHMAQLMPLPLTVSCFSKIQIGFTFLVPAHPGSPRKRAVKRVSCSSSSSSSIRLMHVSLFSGTNPAVINSCLDWTGRIRLLDMCASNHFHWFTVTARHSNLRGWGCVKRGCVCAWTSTKTCRSACWSRSRPWFLFWVTCEKNHCYLGASLQFIVMLWHVPVIHAIHWH